MTKHHKIYKRDESEYAQNILNPSATKLQIC